MTPAPRAGASVASGQGEPPPPRYIFSRFGSRQVADLLQTIFAAEILSPSRCLWLVSPWVSDIVVLDNSANTFTTIEPGWARTRVRLSAALLHLLAAGTYVHVATRPGEHSRDFLMHLRELGGSTGRLRIHEPPELHQKGILGDWYYLGGSMNLTFTGVTVNDEALHFTTDHATVAQHQVAFRAHWGGV